LAPVQRGTAIPHRVCDTCPWWVENGE
jgi:hypothetical protein